MSEPANSSYYNILTRKIFEDKFVELSRKYLRGNMIDIGCGIKPYQPRLKSFVTSHVGVDHMESFHDKSNVDLFGTAYSIPVSDSSFQSAICTAVLEHLEDPFAAISECERVLENGGYAIYSIPFIWHLHEEPRDFFRYSKYGISYLFQKAGFEVVEMVPLAGFWVTFIQLQIYYWKRFDRGLVRRLRLHKIFAWLMQKIGFFVHRFDHSYKWTWMYIVVVKKPTK